MSSPRILDRFTVLRWRVRFERFSPVIGAISLLGLLMWGTARGHNAARIRANEPTGQVIRERNGSPAH